MAEGTQDYLHKIILPALCWNNHRSDFYAVTDDISSSGIRFRAATAPSLGEDLICNIRYVGKLSGRVVRAAKHSFVVRVVAKRHLIDSIMREMVQLSAGQQGGARLHTRVRPHMTDVTIALADGRVLPGQLLNVSASGAAFTLEEPLEVGTTILLGQTFARVVRHFENGFGAVFMTPLDPISVTEHLTL